MNIDIINCFNFKTFPDPRISEDPVAADRAITAGIENLAFLVNKAANFTSRTACVLESETCLISTKSLFYITDLVVLRDGFSGDLPLNGVQHSFFKILESTFHQIVHGETSIKIVDPPNLPAFKPAVLSIILLLLTRPIGREIIYSIIKHSDKVITIFPVHETLPENCTFRMDNEKQIFIHFKLDPDFVIVFSDSHQKLKPETSPAVVSLGHELAHAKHFCEKSRDQQLKDAATPSSLGLHYTNVEEELTICNEENQLRSEFGLALRVGHLGVDPPSPLQTIHQPDTIAYFHQLCQAGCELEVLQLLNQGMHPDCRNPEDGNQYTATMLAAKFGRPNILRILFEAKANPFVCSKDWSTLLHYGLMSGDLDTVIFLLSTAPSLVFEADQLGRPLLHYAVTHLKEKSGPFLELLLLAGANVCILTPKRESALFPAAGLADSTIFDSLVQWGLHPYTLNYELECPVHHALRGGNVNLAKRLLYPLTIDKLYALTINQNSLMHAAVASECIQTVDALLEMQRQLRGPFQFQTHPNANGVLPFGIALDNVYGKKGQLFIRALLERGFIFSQLPLEQLKPELVNYVSLFVVAEEPLRSQMLETVYRLPDSIDQPLCREEPLLHWAIKAGDVVLTKYALNKGATVNPKIQMPSDTTPLHLAASFRQPELVRVLIRHGADTKALDGMNRSPLTLAEDIFNQTNIFEPNILSQLRQPLPYQLVEAVAHRVISTESTLN